MSQSDVSYLESHARSTIPKGHHFNNTLGDCVYRFGTAGDTFLDPEVQRQTEKNLIKSLGSMKAACRWVEKANATFTAERNRQAARPSLISADTTHYEWHLIGSLADPKPRPTLFNCPGISPQRGGIFEYKEYGSHQREIRLIWDYHDYHLQIDVGYLETAQIYLDSNISSRVVSIAQRMTDRLVAQIGRH